MVWHQQIATGENTINGGLRLVDLVSAKFSRITVFLRSAFGLELHSLPSRKVLKCFRIKSRTGYEIWFNTILTYDKRRYDMEYYMHDIKM